MKLGGVSLSTGVQQLCHLVAQLECSTLKAHVCTRADFQNEAKVNVDQPALGVYQDVAVMAILRLQQVASNGVPTSCSLEQLLASAAFFSYERLMCKQSEYSQQHRTQTKQSALQCITDHLAGA